MHVNVQLRFNPATAQDAPYYRLKESYHDVRAFAEIFWQRMIDEGGIDRFNQNENKTKKENEKYIDLIPRNTRMPGTWVRNGFA
ncbi:hypothetical protein LJC37_04240, partial [Bacteroidales bacterium OttesenSCG-928-E04]|nr:hypothetical protein [Bacteroidales bacterium OttesenSCG-928-E04]